MIAVLHRSRLEPCRVQPGVRLGHRKAGLLFPGDQRRQKALFLLVAAEYDHRVEPKDVHVDRRGTAESGARLSDRLHQDRSFGNAEPAAAISLRHRNAEPASLRHRLVELVREAAFLILLQPVFIAKTLAQARNGGAHLLVLRRQGKAHLAFHNACREPPVTRAASRRTTRARPGLMGPMLLRFRRSPSKNSRPRCRNRFVRNVSEAAPPEEEIDEALPFPVAQSAEGHVCAAGAW